MSNPVCSAASSTQYTPEGTAFDLHGSEDAPIVVLIHGLGLDRHTWDALTPPLASVARLVRYDLAGHGESADHPAVGNLGGYADQVCRLLDHLGAENAILVGFSLGGMINRRVAIDHRERVAGLAILNSPHERSPQAQRLVEERAAASDGGPGATIDATLERWFTDDFRASQPASVAVVRRLVLANDPDTFAGCRAILAHGVRELIRPVPPIDVPTLIMTCENDSGSTPAMARAIATEIEQAQLVIVPDLRHLGLLEAPEPFVGPLVEFINAHRTHRSRTAT